MRTGQPWIGLPRAITLPHTRLGSVEPRRTIELADEMLGEVSCGARTNRKSSDQQFNTAFRGRAGVHGERELKGMG